MKQDMPENNDVSKSVEQDASGPPGDTFYISEELAERLRYYVDKPFLIGG